MPRYEKQYDPERGPYLDITISKPASLYPSDAVELSRKRLTMLIDTGASKTAISTRIAHELGLDPIGKRRMTLASGEMLANLYYADLEFTDMFPSIYLPALQVVEFPLHESWRDGLIGRDFLAGLTIELNAPERKFVLTYVPSH
jgi:predicted aspartyl protease